MDETELLKRTITKYLAIIFVLENIVLGACLYLLIKQTNLKITAVFIISAVLAISLVLLISIRLSKLLIQPIRYLREGIFHISPNGAAATKAPDLNQLKIGQQLITNLVGQIYQIAQTSNSNAMTDSGAEKLTHSFIANSIPLPLFVLDSGENIKFVNRAAAEYIGFDPTDLVGKNVYMILDMSFPSEDTFDYWLKTVKQNTASATKSWERVKLNVRDNHPTLLFDLAAYYNQANEDGNATLLVLFDHTKQYSQDDQAVSFIALSVHELRTPLTLLRGYIEVFEEELKGNVSPELEDFIDKMRAASDQLMSFVSNILNVARVDDDQLELRLNEEDWSTILNKAIEGIRLRAKVRDINIEVAIQDNLPKVAVDRLSIQEVINNLIDNAIKYSGESKTIKIESKLKSDGLIETTVQDFGVGITASIMPNLFTKFYRDHRNRAQVGGTGLGLYLCKSIITAHGGNIWVRSTDGKGSIFGFTLIPYAQVANTSNNNKEDELIRSAHGWIKNHSYYRR